MAQISSSTHLFLCYRQKTPGILMQTHTDWMQNKYAITERIHNCNMSCMFDHKIIFNKQKHWTAGKHIKVPNHYRVIFPLSFIAHHLAHAFTSIKKCQKLQLCREIQLAGYLSFRKEKKNNKTTSALHNRINTFTARFPSASYVKQQTFKSFLCSEAACPAGCKHRIHMGSADGYFRSHMKSILSPIKLPTHVRGVQAWQYTGRLHVPWDLSSGILCLSFSLSNSFFVSLCLEERTIYTNTPKYTHIQTHATA